MWINFSVTRVELETTSYNISESDEVVQACINVAGANTPCSNTDRFQLTLNTADQSAGKMLCVFSDIHMHSKMSYSDLTTILLIWLHD